MKHLLGTFLAIVALFTSLTAHAGDGLGAYWRAGAGAAFAKDMDLVLRGAYPSALPVCEALTGCTPVQRIVELDEGFAANGAVGYGFSSGFRSEIEYRYSRNRVASVQTFYEDQTPVFVPDGTFDRKPFTAHSVFANGYYDIQNSSPFTPFIGGGIGIVFIEDDVGGEDTAFSYQGQIGLAYRVNDSFILETTYTHQRTTDVSFEESSGSVTPAYGEPYIVSNVLLSLRHHF